MITLEIGDCRAFEAASGRAVLAGDRVPKRVKWAARAESDNPPVLFYEDFPLVTPFGISRAL